MITLGLTTWNEHPALIHNEDRPVTLSEYSAYFPTVELDTFFYGIPRISTVENWQAQVPESFQFVVKANKVLTLHEQSNIQHINLTFHNFLEILQPLIDKNQLKTVLFQFPPYFTLNKKSTNYLRYLRQKLPNISISLEFRHKSWYNDTKKLVNFCRELGFTLVIADEPSRLDSSVPFLPVITNPNLTFFRLHGRNIEGWENPGKNWRAKRTLYRYSDDELLELKQVIQKLQSDTKEICVIFNNNSGKDAAPNALKLQEFLNITFDNLGPKPPEQLNFF